MTAIKFKLMDVNNKTAESFVSSFSWQMFQMSKFKMNCSEYLEAAENSKQKVYRFTIKVNDTITDVIEQTINYVKGFEPNLLAAKHLLEMQTDGHELDSPHDVVVDYASNGEVISIGDVKQFNVELSYELYEPKARL